MAKWIELTFRGANRHLKYDRQKPLVWIQGAFVYLRIKKRGYRQNAI